MLALPGQTRAPRVSRAAHREPRQSCLSVARQSRTGFLDEVDGVPLALDRARLFLSGCRNSNLDDILTSPCLHIQAEPSITTLEESPSSISNRRTLLKSKVATSLVASPKLSLAPLEYSVVTTVLNTHFAGDVIFTPSRTWRLSRCGSLAWPKPAFGPIDWYSISRP